MGIKKSVHIADPSIPVLAAFSDAGNAGMNWSGAINSMAEHMAVLMADLKPDLTENQWRALYCLYNGYVPHPKPQEEAKMLPWHIDQGYQYDEQVRGFLGDLDATKAFIRQVESMSIAQRIAMIHSAKLFWRKGPKADEQNYGE